MSYMESRISTRQKLLSQLESTDALLRVILNTITKRHIPINLEPLVELLLEKDQQLKITLMEVEKQTNIMKQIELLRSDCMKSDRQINSCQTQLKKVEIVLSTALYYSRQKLDAMATAVNNPVDVEEVIKLSHHISATHGVCAPDNWMQGDPRRPYPNKEEIRRGYLGHLDDDGYFNNSLWDVLSETATAASAMANTSQSSVATTGGMSSSSNHSAVQLPGPVTASVVHGTDLLAMSASPTMVLPGVNMVSSPMTATSQGNTNAWQGNIVAASGASIPTGAETSSSSGLSRPHTTSLATMLTAGCANPGQMDSHSRQVNTPTGVGGNLLPPSLPTMRLTTSTGQQQMPSGAGSSSRLSATTAASTMANTGHKPTSRAVYSTNTPPAVQSKAFHTQMHHQHLPSHHQGSASSHQQGLQAFPTGELSAASGSTGRRRAKGPKRQLSAHGDTETLSSLSSSDSSTGD